MVELTPIKISKVISTNSGLRVFIPKKICELAGFHRGDYVKWYWDSVKRRIVLERSEFMDTDFPPKTVQDSKEVEEEKNG